MLVNACYMGTMPWADHVGGRNHHPQPAVYSGKMLWTSLGRKVGSGIKRRPWGGWRAMTWVRNSRADVFSIETSA